MKIWAELVILHNNFTHCDIIISDVRVLCVVDTFDPAMQGLHGFLLYTVTPCRVLVLYTFLFIGHNSYPARPRSCSILSCYNPYIYQEVDKFDPAWFHSVHTVCQTLL